MQIRWECSRVQVEAETRVPWKGTAGLAADIRYYGAWMREEAYKRIGHLYPKVQLPDGTSATVVAWVWARTVPCSQSCVWSPDAVDENLPNLKEERE